MASLAPLSCGSHMPSWLRILGTLAVWTTRMGTVWGKAGVIGRRFGDFGIRHGLGEIHHLLGIVLARFRALREPVFISRNWRAR
jgi:hypothetical protein